MQLLILALVLGIFLHDAQALAIPLAGASGWKTLALTLGPKLLLAGTYFLLCRITLRRLSRGAGVRALRGMDRCTWAYRYALLGLYGADLRLGVLVRVRDLIGNVVLLDELVFILPTLLLVAWSWWAYYPIDARVRQAALIRRMDEGLPALPLWTRTQYLVSQVRHQVALVLAPLLIIIAWEEVIGFIAPTGIGPLANVRPALFVLGVGCLFLFAPVMIRHIWDTVPLPQGTLRDTLAALCRQHRVGVRELLMWRTYGGMINAAVMGLFAPLRYILLTDALIETVPARQVEAVMAHEVAHVRRHHMPWLLAAAGGSWIALGLAWMAALSVIRGAVPLLPAVVAEAGLHRFTAITGLSPHDAVLVLGLILSWILVFGWISRRFERQADTFAVQHLAQQRAAAAGETGPAVADAVSIATMVEALDQVAKLNHIARDRRSWRHGSIAWRQAYLLSLRDQRLDRLGIDRQVRIIKVVSAIALAAVAAVQLMWPAMLTGL